MDGEKLVRCASVSSGTRTSREETYQRDQRDSKFTSLLDHALRCAIIPCRHDPGVSPPDIEDTTHGLQKVKRKKGELSRKFKLAEQRGAETLLGTP